MVEELLQLLITEVDADLLEAVELYDDKFVKIERMILLTGKLYFCALKKKKENKGNIETITHVEDFKAGDIQHTDERVSLETSFKGFITLGNDELEGTVKQSLGHGAEGVAALVNVHALRHELSTDLDLGFGHSQVHVIAIGAHECCNFFSRLKENK